MWDNFGDFLFCNVMLYMCSSPHWAILMRTQHTFMLKKIEKIPIMPPGLAI